MIFQKRYIALFAGVLCLVLVGFGLAWFCETWCWQLKGEPNVHELIGNWRIDKRYVASVNKYVTCGASRCSLELRLDGTYMAVELPITGSFSGEGPEYLNTTGTGRWRIEKHQFWVLNLENSHGFVENLGIVTRCGGLALANYFIDPDSPTYLLVKEIVTRP